MTLVCLFCLGSYRFAHYTHQFTHFYQKFDNQICDIQGTIVEIEMLNRPRFSQLITLNVRSIKTHDQVYENIHNTVLQIYSSRSTDLGWNDNVLIKNIKIKKPNSANYESYLHKEGVACSLFAYNLDYTILERRASLMTRIKTMRQNIMLACKEKMSETTFALFSLILHRKQNHS